MHQDTDLRVQKFINEGYPVLYMQFHEYADKKVADCPGLYYKKNNRLFFIEKLSEGTVEVIEDPHFILEFNVLQDIRNILDDFLRWFNVQIAKTNDPIQKEQLKSEAQKYLTSIKDSLDGQIPFSTVRELLHSYKVQIEKSDTVVSKLVDSAIPTKKKKGVSSLTLARGIDVDFLKDLFDLAFDIEPPLFKETEVDPIDIASDLFNLEQRALVFDCKPKVAIAFIIAIQDIFRSEHFTKEGLLNATHVENSKLFSRKKTIINSGYFGKYRSQVNADPTDLPNFSSLTNLISLHLKK